MDAMDGVRSLMAGELGATLTLAVIICVIAAGVTWVLFFLVDVFYEDEIKLEAKLEEEAKKRSMLTAARLLQEQQDALIAMFEERGWRQDTTEVGRLEFDGEGFVASLKLELVEHSIIHSVSCQIRPEHAPPSSLMLVIKDSNRVFPSTHSPWRSESKANHNGVFMYDDLRFEGDMKVLVDCCVDTVQLFAHADSRIEVSTFSIRDGVCEMEFRLLTAEDLEAYQPQQRVIARDALGRYADLLSLTGAAFSWPGKSKKEILAELLNNPESGWSIRRDASSRYIHYLDDEERVPWLIAQIKASESDPVEAGHLLGLLQNLGPDEREVSELVDLAMTRPLLLRLFLANSRELITRRLLGPDKEAWFSAVFANDGGLTEEHMREVIAHLDPNFLLSPGLSGKARGVLLANMMSEHSEAHFDEVVHTLLREMDDEDLVAVLETLALHHDAGIARAAAQLAANPKQIDTTREYQALLGILRSQLQEHAELLRQPGVEQFLCHCIEHPDERIAAMAPPLLVELGGTRALSLLSNLISTPGLMVSPSVLGKTIQGIRQRLGGDTSGFIGGLSVADAAGGELTVVTAESGAISISE